MTARVRLLMSFVLTFAIVGSGALTWGLRTGQLTIFGDTAPTVDATLTVASAIDLQKGVAAGDGQLVVGDGGLVLTDQALHGTAVFTLGQREIVAIDRIVPRLHADRPATARITMAVAGSPDGVSFNGDSPTQTVTTSTTNPTGVPIDLGFLIPPDSRFVRVTVAMSRADLNDQPSLTGFAVNYRQLAPNVGGTHDGTVLVNGSAVNAPTENPPPSAGRPVSLVVTGGPDWWLIGFVTLWLVGLCLIWFGLRRREGHVRERAG